MAVYNLDWYDLNSQRGYPFDDNATGTTDDAQNVPYDLLVDCRLRFPSTAGTYAFVGGLTVTPNLVTLTILGATDPQATSISAFTPLAVLTLPQPVTPYRHYDLQPLTGGVGGWVVFGEGIAQPFQGRFSSPSQSLLMPRTALAYPPRPVRSVGELFRDSALAGLVQLQAGTDITITKQQLTIQGDLREALVIGLNQNQPDNVLAYYVGPCNVRPESNNCAKPGVQYINTVGPDCHGNINILFQNLTVGPYADCGPGVTLDQPLGLAAVCAANKPPLQIDPYQDLCAPTPVSSLSSHSLSVSSQSAPSLPSISSVSVSCDELPYCESFDFGTAKNFVIKSGAFTFEPEDSPGELCGYTNWDGYRYLTIDMSYCAIAGYTRNVSVWDDCGYTDSLNKRITTDVQLSTSTPSRNGGLVLNYHIVNPGSSPHVEYFLAMIDANVNKFRILRYNGTGFIEEYASAVLPLIMGDWYRIEIEITSLSSNQVAISGQLLGISDPSFATLSFSISTTHYLPADGKFGVGSNNAHACFSYFRLEEIIP